jgi:hypothetical protein
VICEDLGCPWKPPEYANYSNIGVVHIAGSTSGLDNEEGVKRSTPKFTQSTAKAETRQPRHHSAINTRASTATTPSGYTNNGLTSTS